MPKQFREIFTIDSSDDKVSMLMKMQCVMKDSWRITNFPFDQQKLRLSIENSQFDSHILFLYQILQESITIRGLLCVAGTLTVVS